MDASRLASSATRSIAAGSDCVARATQSDPAAIDLVALEASLLASIVEHHPTADLEPVRQAFALAVLAHEGQLRATGEPYVAHPIASAQIVADLGIDPVAIEA